MIFSGQCKHGIPRCTRCEVCDPVIELGKTRSNPIVNLKKLEDVLTNQRKKNEKET